MRDSDDEVRERALRSLEALHDPRHIAQAVEPLNCIDLNHHSEVGVPTPSAERVAEVLAGWLAPELATQGGALLTVSVWEGPDNRVDLNLEE